MTSPNFKPSNRINVDSLTFAAEARVAEEEKMRRAK